MAEDLDFVVALKSKYPDPDVDGIEKAIKSAQRREGKHGRQLSAYKDKDSIQTKKMKEMAEDHTVHIRAMYELEKKNQHLMIEAQRLTHAVNEANGACDQLHDMLVVATERITDYNDMEVKLRAASEITARYKHDADLFNGRNLHNMNRGDLINANEVMANSASLVISEALSRPIINYDVARCVPVMMPCVRCKEQVATHAMGCGNGHAVCKDCCDGIERCPSCNNAVTHCAELRGLSEGVGMAGEVVKGILDECLCGKSSHPTIAVYPCGYGVCTECDPKCHTCPHCRQGCDPVIVLSHYEWRSIRK